jgi:hypothetical protein
LPVRDPGERTPNVHPAPSLCISLLQILEGFFDVFLSFGQFTQGGQNFSLVPAFVTSKPRLRRAGWRGRRWLHRRGKKGNQEEAVDKEGRQEKAIDKVEGGGVWGRRKTQRVSHGIKPL